MTGHLEVFFLKFVLVMLKVIHPDVWKVVWRYGRYHHHVDYGPFKNNEPKYVKGYNPEKNRSETELFVFDRVKI